MDIGYSKLIRCKINFCWLLMTVFLLSGLALQAQTKAIFRGKVIDEDGEPLVGVSIISKAKPTKGVVTNLEGQFTLYDVEQDETYVVKYIGYKTKSFRIRAGKSFVQIRMRLNSRKIKEVVVTAEQVVKKFSLTGTSTIVKNKDLQTTNSKSVFKALEVFDPSFRMLDNVGIGADPNRIREINIRGASSITGDVGLEMENARINQRTNLRDNPNMPIFMLDGFEVSVQKIYDMDINRIQSMSILKDAAATALYGSRAANGVIIVTTIPPKAGEIRVDLSSTLELTFPDLSDYNLANALEKLQVEKDAGLYNGRDEFNTILNMLKFNEKWNEVHRGASTHWIAQPLRNAYNSRNYIGASGGIEKKGNDLRYMLDFNYDKNSGVMKGSYRNRYGIGLMLQYRRGDWFRIMNRASFDKVNNEDSPYGFFNDYSYYQPYDAVKNKNGELFKILPMSKTVNPLWEQANLANYYNKGKTEDFTNNLSLSIYFTPNFFLDGNFSLSKIKANNDSFKDPKNPKFNTLAPNKKGELQSLDEGRFKWNSNLLLHYNKVVGNHFFNLIGGIDGQETKDKSVYYTFQGFSTQEGQTIEATELKDKTKIYERKNLIIGAVTALNYAFKETYLFDASLRLDGSSQLGTDTYYAPFASTGLGLNIHGYDFVKDRYPYINTFRIKATYGTSGKINFLQNEANQRDSSDWYFRGPLSLLLAKGNSAVSRDQAKTLDLGLTLELFNRRFFLEVNYYYKRNEGRLEEIPAKESKETELFNDRIGTIINKGWELKTNITPYKDKNLTIVLNANMAINKNRIAKLNKGLEVYNEKVRENYNSNSPKYPRLQSRPLTMYYPNASTSAIYAVPSLGIDPASGEEYFIKKDGSISKEWRAEDMLAVGDRNPIAQGAFGINISYKQVYLNASFLYAWGGQLYNQTLLDKVENANIKDHNVDRRVITDRWRKVGQVAPFYDLGRSFKTRPTSRYVQNDNYLKFTNLSIGYDFSRSFVSKLKLSRLSLLLQASGLADWTSIKMERGLSFPYAHVYSVNLRMSY